MSAAGARAAPVRILIVEDEPMIGRILVNKLRREGHDVTLVPSGADALEVAEARGGGAAFDVALVDATLECDGIVLGADLVAGAAVARGGWLAMVSARDRAAAERAIASGAADVVLKPFKPTQVAARVADAMRDPAAGIVGR